MEIKWLWKTPEVHSISSQQNHHCFNFQLVFRVNEALLHLFLNIFLFWRRVSNKNSGREEQTHSGFSTRTHIKWCLRSTLQRRRSLKRCFTAPEAPRLFSEKKTAFIYLIIFLDWFCRVKSDKNKTQREDFFFSSPIIVGTFSWGELESVDSWRAVRGGTAEATLLETLTLI